MSLPQRARASAVCVHAGRLLCVRLRDPSTRVLQLFVPGGAIEPGEDPRAAAERETFEETGYRVLADPHLRRVARYEYVWDGTARAITTHFFRAQLSDPAAAPEPVTDVAYNEGTAWLPLVQVESALGFHAQILAAVTSLLDP